MSKSKGGGGGKAHDYYGSIAGLVCAGPVDALVAIVADGKTVWPDAPEGDWETAKVYATGARVRSLGRVWSATSTHTSSSLNAPGLGSHWAETVLRRTDVGVTNPHPVAVAGYGTAVLFWGTDTQVHTGAVPAEISATHPPYRRQCWVVLKDWLFGRERVPAPNVEFVVRRKPNQTLLTGAPAALDADGQANLLAFMAEVMQDPVFGVGRPEALDPPTWQATAEALTAAGAHLSPRLSAQETFRAFGQAFADYHDGWLRANSAGLIEAGLFPQGEAPPAWTAANTVDVHDLIEELDYAVNPEVQSEATVRFTDRTKAFKDRTVRAQDALNRNQAPASQGTTLELPWVQRAGQALGHAARYLRAYANPGLAGTLVARAEAVEAIQPGSLFLLEAGAAGMSVPCRCEGKTLSEPPGGRATLRFRSHRNLSPGQVQAAPTNPAPPVPPAPETVSLYQFVQPPPAMVDGDPFALAVLAARTSPVSVRMKVHLREDDADLFYELGAQDQWAVFGVLAADYAADLPGADVEPPDDETEGLRITLDAATPAPDLELLGETQSADAVNDAALLVWVFRASNPRLFEVMTVKAVRILGADAFHRFKVRRGRFGTQRLAFTAGDRAFILRRANLVTHQHGRFGAYATAGTAATFRLQASNPWAMADLADPAACPDRTFTFADPYSPTVTWVAIQKRVPPALTWSNLTDFSANCDPATEFRLTVHLEDPTGDLASVTLQASIGTVAVPLFVGPVAGREAEVVSVFRLGIGDWNVVARVVDQSGRVTEAALTEIGGSDVVTLRVHAAGTTQVANPVATPRGGFYDARPNVVLTCSSAGSEIRYSVVALGAAPGTYSVFSAPISMPLNRTLYAYAVDAVGSAESSEVVRHDYRRLPYTESGSH